MMTISLSHLEGTKHHAMIKPFITHIFDKFLKQDWNSIATLKMAQLAL